MDKVSIRFALALFAAAPWAAAGQEPAPAPDDVADVVERELILDRAVPANRIDVEIADGVVTLTGRVPHALAKERATRCAETVKGVRSIVNLVEVRPTGRLTDEDIRRGVLSALRTDPAAGDYDVDVPAVSEGAVVLQGAVSSWKQRELAERVAKGVAGVTRVTNEIAVDYAVERPDEEIAEDVRHALRWNALVDHALIDVDVREGVVSLRGTAGSAAEKRQAIRTAWTAGVRSVEFSELEVSRWARDDDLREDKYAYRPDDAVEAAVESALAADPRVEAELVATSVHDSIVTLRGVVGDLKAKRAAAQDAMNTVGVGVVNNYLKVRPDEEREAEAIAQDVRSAFVRDPYVDRFEIETRVVDGTVYLYGTVDSFFEKAQADDIAARVRGVTDVSNNLLVEDTPYTFDPYVDDWRIYGFEWYDFGRHRTDKTDAMLEKDIESEFFWSPFVDAASVSVDVDDGVALLTGDVESWMERRSARDNAYEAGAVLVRNQLVVEPDTEESSAGGGGSSMR